MGDKIRELQALQSCGDEFVERQASMALEIADAQAVGNISSEQAKELMEDLVRTENIEGKTEDIVMLGQLVTGVMGLAALV